MAGCASCKVVRMYVEPSPLPMLLGGGVTPLPWGGPAPASDCGCGCDGAGSCELPPRAAGALDDDAALTRVATGYLRALDHRGGGPHTRSVSRSAGVITYAQVERWTDRELCEALRSTGRYSATERGLLEQEQSIRGLSDADCTRIATGTSGPPMSEGGWGLGGEDDRSGLGSSYDDTEAARTFDSADSAERRRIAETAARRVESGTDAESERRRDAIVQEAMRGGFTALNSYLDRNYRTRIEEIHGSTSITLATISAEDRERERLFQLERERIRQTGGGGSSSSSGGGQVLAVVGVIATLLSLAGKS